VPSETRLGCIGDCFVRTTSLNIFALELLGYGCEVQVKILGDEVANIGIFVVAQ
jgi:hypothetical protein